VIYLMASFIIALLMTAYLIPLLIAIACKFGVMDTPDGKLKSHKKATPYLGGIGIYVGFITALALVFPFENNMFLFLVGSTLLLFIGLIDDLIAIEPYKKFFGQIIATFCFLKAGCYLKENFFSYIPNIAISSFWILSVINAFNLVDVMDGLSVTVASMATISFLVCSLLLGCYSVTLLLLAFLGSLLAFLWYNRPEAQIYLGDAGSLFIGGFLATVPFMLPWSTHTLYGALTPGIILGIPLLEGTTLIAIRLYKGIPFYKGSPDHFCMYLQQNGWAKYEILGYVAFVSSILLLIAVLFVLNVISLMMLLLIFLLSLVVWYSVLMVKRGLKNFKTPLV
jgi:UDP-GlcNAc:undecaprenyl-phosphate/decaprenyl-phosphate GlcNAc-1-phosphate transferase